MRIIERFFLISIAVAPIFRRFSPIGFGVIEALVYHVFGVIEALASTIEGELLRQKLQDVHENSEREEDDDADEVDHSLDFAIDGLFADRLDDAKDDFRAV